MTWPWKGDTATERARRVAHAYREQLMEVLPHRAAELDERYINWGEDWVCPAGGVLELHRWVTVREAAKLVGRSRKAVYAWIDKGQLPVRRTSSGIRVKVKDLFDTQRELRLRRTG